MRYFKDTVPVKIFFPTILTARSLALVFLCFHLKKHRKSLRSNLAVDVGWQWFREESEKESNKTIFKCLYIRTKIFP